MRRKVTAADEARRLAELARWFLFCMEVRRARTPEQIDEALARYQDGTR